jgi:hypothetical protein
MNSIRFILPDANVDFVMGGNWPTEQQFLVFFQYHARALRQHSRLRLHLALRSAVALVCRCWYLNLADPTGIEQQA